MVEILSGNYAGEVGHYSFDDDGTVWITFYSAASGCWRDVLANSVGARSAPQ